MQGEKRTRRNPPCEKEAVMSATQATKQVELENTNRWSTRQLVTMALMCAIAALFSFIQIPLLPAAPFLTYDPSLMPAMVCGFAFGPGAGFVVALAGDIMTMPGLPRVPAAENIDVDDAGNITGLF